MSDTKNADELFGTKPPIHPERKTFQKKEKPQTPEEKLKLAMWYLSMFDDPDEAVACVDVAIKAKREIKKETERRKRDDASIH